MQPEKRKTGEFLSNVTECVRRKNNGEKKPEQLRVGKNGKTKKLAYLMAMPKPQNVKLLA